ncbi:MAG: glycosyltransferase family 4 protein [Chloroflexi bacterium]|nr:glycosyltransferase family 4 protein [Chloroflexota bacterium]
MPADAMYGQRLRIGLIAPPWFAVPPTGYGGIERVVSYLADGLVALGHDVTLFASGGSKTTAKLISPFDVPPSAALGDAVVESQHLAVAYSHWREFDVMHDHSIIGLIAAAALPIPVAHTIHGQVTGPCGGLLRRVHRRVQIIAISEHQRSTLPEGCNATVIHNGIDLDEYPQGPGGGGHLLFVGRLSPDKGVLEAIEIARRAGRHLKMIIKINEPGERAYFEEIVRPAVQGRDVEILEQPPHDVKVHAYGTALATLFPIRWAEPFGLVMAESMACGTPVIAFANGAAPEVVAHGESGYLCRSVDEAVEAVERAGEISRDACRAHVVARFSSEAAVRRHEALYREMACSASRPPLDSPAGFVPRLAAPGAHLLLPRTPAP